MGHKNRSKTRRHSIPSNHRLRSDPIVSHVKSTPLTDLSSLRQYLQSPTLLIPQLNGVRYLNPTPTPSSQPSRSRPQPAGGGSLHPSLRYQAPQVVSQAPEHHEERKALVCTDRAERREVLHALGKTGKGGQTPPVYTWKSKIHCKGGR